MKTAAPEIHASLVRPFLDVAEERFGRDVWHARMQAAGVDAATLDDESAWVSLEFAEWLATALETTAGADLLELCARRALSPRYLGALRPLFRAFGSPSLAYAQVAASTGRFNKVGRMSLESRSRRTARLAYAPLVDAPRESPITCRVRRANLGAITTLFDLPPAEVAHRQCMHDGADRCVYDLRWSSTNPRYLESLGGALGAATGGTLARLVGERPFATVVSAAMAGVCGYLIARLVGQRGVLAERARQIEEQHEALARALVANEQRFAQLVEAKAEVDKKVEARTAELAETSRRLAETLAEVQALDRAKTTFFANVSHDLRTPLTLLIGPLDDLIHGREPPGGTEAALEAMSRNARRLLRLIHQLLELARVDAGEARPDRRPTDVVALARAALDGFEAAAEARGVQVRFGSLPLPAPAAVDPAWIESALVNLVGNALRFVPRGGHIDVDVAARDGELVLRVEDDGPGIPPEELGRVFDRFAQAGTESQRQGGSGLGLSIVHEAARLHGGHVEVASEMGHGARFTFRVPYVEAPISSGTTGETDAGSGTPATKVRAEARDAVLAELERSHAVAADAETDVPPVGPKDAPLALVVEDDPDVRGYVCGVLSRTYRVVAAVDGERGLDLARATRPDVIVSDVSMPRRDGFELVRALRADEDLRRTPVLLLTAAAAPESTLEGFDAGADDFIAKPFHGRELLARVDAHVRLRRTAELLVHRERLATLGATAASVAHHVRNPLMVLRSGLPAMKKRLRETADARTLELLDVLDDCAARIERLTVDLLDLSRIDRESRGDYAPGAGLLAALRLVSARLPNGIELHQRVDAEYVTRGRAGDMNHVFLNLLDNAARSVGERGTIEVTGERVDGGYAVRIADSGSGIPDSYVGRIFEAFWTTRASGEGTGLGLAIAKQVVEAEGGHIQVRRSALGGAEFTLHIPYSGTDVVASMNRAASS